MKFSKCKSIILFMIILFVKELIFIFLGSSKTGTTFDGVSIDIYMIVPHMAVFGLILFPSLLFNEKGRNKYLLTTDLIFTAFIIMNLWIYRASGYFFEIKSLIYKDLFNQFERSLFNPNIIDLVFFIDIVVLTIYYNKNKASMVELRKVANAIIGFMLCLALVIGWHYFFDIKRIADGNVRFIQDDWEAAWNPATKIANRSLLGDFVYQGLEVIKSDNKINEAEMEQVDKWLMWNNEKLPDNQYKGLFSGKNVVFLQIESLENFVINQEVYGQEITPVMNKLTKEGLYFNNIYEQNNAGNSIDCDLMANTGVLPLGDSITFLTHPQVKYNSLARRLEQKGYTTVSTHAERAGDWNFAKAHKAALGFQNIWDINQYNVDEVVGFGLSDRSFYTQYAQKLSTLKQPFFSMLPTLSSHGPFDIKGQYRELKLPEELDKNKLGGYFQSIHYADEQIGLFLNLLEEKGLMKNTVVVIYGDHGGIHKYYQEDIDNATMSGEWWKDYQKQIPFIIYSKDMPNKKIETIGGHIDIMPTVAYLLGAETGDTVMGRNLLNTNRNSTVIKGNEIKGSPSQEEKEYLLNAYDIANYIIKNDYFYNRGIVK